jgi:hypothetical protein
MPRRPADHTVLKYTRSVSERLTGGKNLAINVQLLCVPGRGDFMTLAYTFGFPAW